MHLGGQVMKTLVVTGGIGSGKSAVCSILRDVYGCGVYEADSRVKMLYHEHKTLLADIEGKLGESYRDAEGNFQPKLLAERIFRDRDALNSVEEMVFPVLVDDFRKWAEGYKNDGFVVFESATILEKPYFKDFGDMVLLVDAPFEVRLERACTRDGMTRETVMGRMQQQMLMNAISNGEAEAAAHAVIRNVGTFEELKDLTVRVTDEILNLNSNIR